MVNAVQDLTPIAVQVWAEALTSPTLHRLVADLYTQLRDGVADLIRRHQDAGAISADVDPESAAHHLPMPGTRARAGARSASTRFRMS